MTTVYNLYLDESSVFPMFCVAGFIIKESELEKVNTEVKKIKDIIWSDSSNPHKIILHEKDVKSVHQNGFKNDGNIPLEYKRFENGSVAKQLYIEVYHAIKRLDLKVIGACINTQELESYYSKRNMTNHYLTAMQSIIENFAQYLIKNNGIGKIILESRDDATANINSEDRKVRTHFMNIMSIGSMFLSNSALQDVILSIEFIPKSENNPCVQLADFIPNQFARKETHKESKIYALYPILQKKLYDGTLKQPERFGMKVIPCPIPASPTTETTKKPIKTSSKRKRGSRGRKKIKASS
uniref:DUF3800 domain-containing protein n=1 Tax=Vibrio anguillarum TaxID=55601 RepID=I3VZB9_VIBAN|nr:DUF3800 domain-containing protein [Vibrio anguillarum]AFK88696.1 conserved hypothetical protein [Vibrio anguillarum]